MVADVPELYESGKNLVDVKWWRNYGVNNNYEGL